MLATTSTVATTPPCPYAATSSKESGCIVYVWTILVMAGIPILQFGLLYPLVYANRDITINKTDCRNYCWDVRSKGSYEGYPGVYHEVYFNSNMNTACIWTIIVVYIATTREVFGYIASVLRSGSAEMAYFWLFALTFFSHHYAIWSYIGYFNDNYWVQFYHQTLFTLSEIASTVCVCILLRKPRGYATNEPRNIPASLLFGINFSHILIGGKDQFVAQLLFGGYSEIGQVVRNIGFLAPDVVACVLAFSDMRRMRRELGLSGYRVLPFTCKRNDQLLDVSLAFTTCFAILLASYLL